MTASKRKLPFIVSTEWLNTNQRGLIVVDVRDEVEYRSGHIAGAVSAPFASWITTRGGLMLELPDEADLFDVIGRAGISPDSAVVVAGKTDGNYPRADTARVACTLVYAGVSDVSILDGGYNKWTAEGRPLTTEASRATPLAFQAKTNDDMFVTRDYVRRMIGRALILDNRDPEAYIGLILEPTTARPGHVPTARCLPAPWLWTAQGTYRPIDEIGRLAQGMVGKDLDREIILYCGVGGYASAWWFVLTQGLGYRKVRFYDGSAQDWAGDPQAPMVSFQWE